MMLCSIHAPSNSSTSSIFIFNSPDNRKLCSLEEVSLHLTTPGTCKCGLRCPIKIEKQFSFDPDTISLPDNFQPSENMPLPCKVATQNLTMHVEPVVSLNKQHSIGESLPVSGSLSIAEAPSTSVSLKKQTSGMKRTLSYSLIPTVSISKKPKLTPSTLKPVAQDRQNRMSRGAKLVQRVKKTTTVKDSVVRVQKKLLSLLKKTSDITSVCFPSDAFSPAGTASTSTISVLESGGGSTKLPSTSSHAPVTNIQKRVTLNTNELSEVKPLSVSELNKLKKPIVQQSHLQEILQKAKHLSEVSSHQRLVPAQTKNETAPSILTGHTLVVSKSIKDDVSETVLSSDNFETKSFPDVPIVIPSSDDGTPLDQMCAKKPDKVSPVSEPLVSNELSTETLLDISSLSPSFVEPVCVLNMDEQVTTPIVAALPPHVENVTNGVQQSMYVSQEGDSQVSKPLNVSISGDRPSIISISERPNTPEQNAAPLEHTSPTCKEPSQVSFSQNVLNDNRQLPCEDQTSPISQKPVMSPLCIPGSMQVTEHKTSTQPESISSDEPMSPAVNPIDAFQTLGDEIPERQLQDSQKDSLLLLSSPNGNINHQICQDGFEGVDLTGLSSEDLKLQRSDNTKIEPTVPDNISIISDLPKVPLQQKGKSRESISTSELPKAGSTSPTSPSMVLPLDVKTEPRIDPDLVQSQLAQNLILPEPHSFTEGGTTNPAKQFVESSPVLTLQRKSPERSSEQSSLSATNVANSQNISYVENSVEFDTATPINLHSDNVLNAPNNNLDSDPTASHSSDISVSSNSLLSNKAALCPTTVRDSFQSCVTPHSINPAVVRHRLETATPNFPQGALSHMTSLLPLGSPTSLQSDTAVPIAPTVRESPSRLQYDKSEPIAPTIWESPNSLQSDKSEPIAPTVQESSSSLQSEPIAPTVQESSSSLQSEPIAPTVQESPNSLQSEPIAPTVRESPNSLQSEPISPTVQESPNSLKSEPISPTVRESPNYLQSNTIPNIPNFSVTRNSLVSTIAAASTPSNSESPNSLLSNTAAFIDSKVSTYVESNDNNLVSDNVPRVSRDPKLPVNSTSTKNSCSNSNCSDSTPNTNLSDVDVAVQNNRVFSDLALDIVVEEYKDEDQRSTPSAVITASAQFRNGTPFSTGLPSPFPSTADHCENGSDTVLSTSHSSDGSLSLKASSASSGSEMFSRTENNPTPTLVSLASHEQYQPNGSQPSVLRTPVDLPPPLSDPLCPRITTRSSTKNRAATSSLPELKSPGSDDSSVVDSVFEAEEPLVHSVTKKKKHKKVIR